MSNILGRSENQSSENHSTDILQRLIDSGLDPKNLDTIKSYIDQVKAEFYGLYFDLDQTALDKTTKHLFPESLLIELRKARSLGLLVGLITRRLPIMFRLNANGEEHPLAKQLIQILQEPVQDNIKEWMPRDRLSVYDRQNPKHNEPEHFARPLNSIPVVLMMGSVVGELTLSDDGKLTYNNLLSLPFHQDQAAQVGNKVLEHLNKGVEGQSNENIQYKFSYYPNAKLDQLNGEMVWTPKEADNNIIQLYQPYSTIDNGPIEDVLEKFKESGSVYAILTASNRINGKIVLEENFSPSGMTKSTGLNIALDRFGLHRRSIVGFGDSRKYDDFLDDVGLAGIVGQDEVPFKGTIGTLHIPSPNEFGPVLSGLIHFYLDYVNNNTTTSNTI